MKNLRDTERGGLMAQQYPPAPPAGGASSTNGLALAGMICGILSIPLGLLIPIVGFLLGILAIVFGAIGRGRAVQSGASQGQASVAIITGSVGLAASIIAFFFYANTF